MKRITRFVVLGFVVLAGATQQPYRLAMIDGASMSPTYRTGEIVVLSHAARDFHRGDVVVFQKDGETLVKRVAFLGGDEIQQFRFEGTWMFPRNPKMLVQEKKYNWPERKIIVPPGYLFVEGDNFFASVDSRTFGPINADAVLGTVLEQRPAANPLFAFANVTKSGGRLAEQD